MGVSGIVGGLFRAKGNNLQWRVVFLLGMILGSFLIEPLGFSMMSIPVDRSLFLVAVGGLCVGLGTTIGNGCTSGHGVCGISRFSVRSIVATCCFMTSAILTVFILKQFGVGL